MGRYVGIDASTQTGLVIIDQDGNLLDSMEITGEGKDPGRMLDIIETTIEQLEPNDIVAIEGFGFSSQSGFILGGIGWGMRMDMYARNIRYIEVAPNLLKKFATNNGNAAKNVIMRDVYKRWRFEHNSDDVVDAFVLAQIARAVDYARRGISLDLTAFQAAVVQTIMFPPSKGKRGA